MHGIMCASCCALLLRFGSVSIVLQCSCTQCTINQQISILVLIPIMRRALTRVRCSQQLHAPNTSCIVFGVRLMIATIVCILILPIVFETRTHARARFTKCKAHVRNRRACVGNVCQVLSAATQRCCDHASLLC